MSCLKRLHRTGRGGRRARVASSALALALVVVSCAPVTGTKGEDEASDDQGGTPPPADAVGGAPGATAVAAAALQATVECDRAKPGRALARLSWAQPARAGAAQRIAITIYGDRFEDGKFELSPELAPGETSLVWDRLHGQAFHYWRVVTQQGGRWVPSETGVFEGPTCVGGTKLVDPMNHGGAP